MAEHLIQTPRELHPELEAAAIRYATMSPSDFAGDTLRVTVTKLRDLGMIATETWMQVPAGGAVRVKREPSSTLVAKVMLPWQRSTDGRGLGGSLPGEREEKGMGRILGRSVVSTGIIFFIAFAWWYWGH